MWDDRVRAVYCHRCLATHDHTRIGEDVVCLVCGRKCEIRNGHKEYTMHYRNGREAKNGDKVVQIDGYGTGGQVGALGVLHSAIPGIDHCNGYIAPIQQLNVSACLCDCLHVDDLAAILKEKGLDKRPEGK